MNEIRKYLLTLIEQLDGYGLVLTDEDLIRERLAELEPEAEIQNICEDLDKS